MVGDTMPYVDGFVVPVPKKKVQEDRLDGKRMIYGGFGPLVAL